MYGIFFYFFFGGEDKCVPVKVASTQWWMERRTSPWASVSSAAGQSVQQVWLLPVWLAEPRHDPRRATQRRRTSKPLKMTPLAGLSHCLQRWLSLSNSQKMMSSSANTARCSRSGRFPRCPGAECEAVPRFLSPSRKCLLLLWLRCEVVTPPSAPNRNLRSGQVQRMVR